MSEIDAKFKRSLARIRQVKERFASAVKGVHTPEYMKEVGDFAAKRIKTRTKLGWSVKDTGAQKERMKPLKQTSVEQRKKMLEQGRLSGLTTPKKSNLTRTGQLLDSIRPKNATRSTVKVGPTGQRDDGKTNQRVGEYVSDAGRPFNNLSDAERQAVTDKIRRDLQNLIRKHLK